MPCKCVTLFTNTCVPSSFSANITVSATYFEDSKRDCNLLVKLYLKFSNFFSLLCFSKSLLGIFGSMTFLHFSPFHIYVDLSFTLCFFLPNLSCFQFIMPCFQFLSRLRSRSETYVLLFRRRRCRRRRFRRRRRKLFVFRSFSRKL